MLFRKFHPSLLLVFLILCSCAPSRPEGFVKAPEIVETAKGQIQNARYKVAKPNHWNGEILIMAPGWRPPKSELVAPIDILAPFESTLLLDGWLVATTSYRRQGLIVEDGLDDLRNLVGKIEEFYGPAEKLIIEGWSMGGAIGVLAAEGNYFPDHIGLGVVAYGVDLSEPGDSGPLKLTHRPQHPLLLMSNRSELESPAQYARKTELGSTLPALWWLDRDGHVNLNSDERLAAIKAMDQWLEAGHRPAGDVEMGWNATVDRQDRPSTATRTTGGWRVLITAVDPIYGNVDTEMVRSDLDDLLPAFGNLGWARGQKSMEVIFGTTYTDAEPGQMVAFVTAEGFVRFAVNGDNAAEALHCSPGDSLTVNRKQWIKTPGWRY